MARHASTYRQARREAWKGANLLNSTQQTWISFNHSEILLATVKDAKRFGPVRGDYAGGAHFLAGRSKYMPHIGAKQRAKGAARAA